MTDRRYTGPDGAKRLELLEELACRLAIMRSTDRMDWRALEGLLDLVATDNERVDRLEKDRDAYIRGRNDQGRYPPR